MTDEYVETTQFTDETLKEALWNSLGYAMESGLKLLTLPEGKQMLNSKQMFSDLCAGYSFNENTTPWEIYPFLVWFETTRKQKLESVLRLIALMGLLPEESKLTFEDIVALMQSYDNPQDAEAALKTARDETSEGTPISYASERLILKAVIARRPKESFENLFGRMETIYNNTIRKNLFEKSPFIKVVGK